jgi:hypothetical protein
MSGAIGQFEIGVSAIGGAPAPSGPPTFKYFPPPPTRILSWEQMCIEADPDFLRLSLRPWVYEFSNGRLFVEVQPIYGTFAITDDFGTAITDDFGTPIQSDGGNSAAVTPSSGGFPFGTGEFGVTGF